MALLLGEFEQLVPFALLRLGPDAYGATVRREIEAPTGREVAISAVMKRLALAIVRADPFEKPIRARPCRSCGR